MIQFSDAYRAKYGPHAERFQVVCPVCEDDIEVGYAWYSADAAYGHRGGVADPSIIRQDCRCLLGEDFLWHAVADYLDDDSLRSRQ